MQQTISARTQPVTEPGTTAPRDHGLYRLDLSLPVDGGFTINTYPKAGVDRIDALCFTVGDADTANLIYRVISEGGDNGVNPDGVRAALDDALRTELHEAQRRRDAESRSRIEHINALLDRLESPADTAAVTELTEHVRRNLSDTVPAGRPSTVASPSRTGVEHKPLTKPQQRIVAGHINGVVYAGKGVAWTSLLSIARKGHAAEVHYEPGTHRIASIVLHGYGHTDTSGVELPVTAADLVTVAGSAEIAVHRDSRAYVATPTALDRYRSEVDWVPIGGTWEDDDTHMIGSVGGEQVAIVKTMTLVIRTTGTGATR